MVAKSRHGKYYINKELESKVLSNFGTTNIKELDKIVLNFLTNGIPTKTQSTDDKLKKLKVADLTLKVWDRLRNAGYSLDQLESFVNSGELSYPEHKTFYAEPEKPKLTTFGTTITHKPKQIQQQDGTLRCKHCNKKIEMKAFDFEQLDDYRKHVETIHGKLDESERIELLGIYPN